MREKPVGSAEKSVLGWLDLNAGQWTERDGTVWESKFWTVRVLKSLVIKGLVTEVVEDAHYVLTDMSRAPRTRR